MLDTFTLNLFIFCPLVVSIRYSTNKKHSYKKMEIHDYVDKTDSHSLQKSVTVVPAKYRKKQRKILI